jgi:hypothetical protein
LIGRYKKYVSGGGDITTLQYMGTHKEPADILHQKLFGRKCVIPDWIDYESAGYLQEYKEFELKRKFKFRQLDLQGYIKFSADEQKLLSEYGFDIARKHLT